MSGPVIHDCEQGSLAWHIARAGRPTASEFDCIVRRLKSGGYSDTRRTYMLKLASEVLTGEPEESFTSYATERGKRLEPEARSLYAMTNDSTPTEVGFITNHGAGCSPDSLIGDVGMLEIKTKRGGLLIEAILAGEFCPEHVAQCQGALWVAEREWIDLCVYWPGLPPFIKRATRDEEYIANLASEVAKFNDELAEIVEKVRRYGEPDEPQKAAA